MMKTREETTADNTRWLPLDETARRSSKPRITVQWESKGSPRFGFNRGAIELMGLELGMRLKVYWLGKVGQESQAPTFCVAVHAADGEGVRLCGGAGKNYMSAAHPGLRQWTRWKRVVFRPERAGAGAPGEWLLVPVASEFAKGGTR